MKLDIGCGPTRLDGYTRCDYDFRFQPDILMDATKNPWPFKDGSADEIHMSHILEHLPNPLIAAKEAYRILRFGGKFIVKVPHRNSLDSIRDWSHIHKDWCKTKMEWLAKPTEYVDGLWFHLEFYRVDSPLRRFLHAPLWFIIRPFQWFAWGELTAIYRKVQEKKHEEIISCIS